MILATRDRIDNMRVPQAATIREALQAVDRSGLGAALLIDEASGAFVGLISEGDLRRALLAGAGLEAPLLSVQRPTSVTALVDSEPHHIVGLFSDAVRLIPLLDSAGRLADVAMLDRRLRLPVAEPLIGERELSYVTECVLSGWVSSTGEFVTKFERQLADLCGTRHAVSVCNGTAALHLALLALDIGPGDEVIVPTLTFAATANAVCHAGATPVFIDSDPVTWNIDPSLVESKITPKTKAIIPVHLYGHPADMDAILNIAKRRGLAVIEDAAEAHGALYRGRPVGAIGDAAVFSFYGNKIVTTGEGGMVTTNDDRVAERARLYRDHGMQPDRRYWHSVLGYNYRLTNIQAALGVAQMERIGSILEAKRTVAARYGEKLAGCPGLQLPPNEEWASNVFWLYTVLLDPEVFGDRDSVMASLKREGIDSRPVFPPVHSQPIYQAGGDFPVADAISSRGISLPSAANLRTNEIDTIAACLLAMASRKQE